MKACPACNTRYDDQTTFCVKDGSPVVPDSGYATQGSMIGQLIADRYRIIKKIGEGGMGEVYVAEHIHIEKKVALKLLRPEVLSNAEAVARFRQEARSASSIGHDNIISIDDFGTLPDGRVYMAMEFLNGMPLNDMLAKEPLPLPRALDILIQTGKGLSAAHAKGITHRDMKPENIFVINKEGRDIPKILDFGIAKVSGGDTAQNLTVAGTIFGTPFYMAPEQAMGGKMDHRVDVYAMGIILYEVFCGTVPFKAETFMGILTQHITMPPTPPSQMAAQNGRIVSHELEAIILKAIQKDPNQRYQTMAELTGALIEFHRFAVGPSATTQMPWANPGFGTTTGRGSASYQMVAGQAGGQAKGKGGLIAAVVGAVVVVGGGGIAVLAMRPSTVRPGPDAAVAVVKPAAPDAGARVASAGPPDAGARVASSGSPDAAPRVASNGPPDAGTAQHNPLPDPHPRTNPNVPTTGGERVDVSIDSTPPGAIISVNGRNFGAAPVVVPIVRGQKTKVSMRLGGYKSETFVVDGSETHLRRNLHPAEAISPDLHAPEDDGLAVPRK
jgi:serine/threonine-protein kinase